jgi:hypothetical protein
MRAIKLRQPAGLDRLEIGTVESSAVGAGQVLVATRQLAQLSRLPGRHRGSSGT